MKIEIEKSEYDRLKSREEKLMAYYEWFVDKNHNLATVKDIITENIRLNKENISLKEENDRLKNNAMEDMRVQTKLEEENKKLKEERIFSLGEYDYMILTSTTPQLKIIKKNQNYSLMEEDTLQELRDIGEI